MNRHQFYTPIHHTRRNCEQLLIYFEFELVLCLPKHEPYETRSRESGCNKFRYMYFIHRCHEHTCISLPSSPSSPSLWHKYTPSLRRSLAMLTEYSSSPSSSPTPGREFRDTAAARHVVCKHLRQIRSSDNTGGEGAPTLPARGRRTG